MTTLAYRRRPPANTFGYRWNYNRLLSNVRGHGLFFGNIIWFLMVFAMTKIYICRIIGG